MDKKEKGQYFTISENLQQFVFDHVKNRGKLLLEPSFGAGHLLKKFKECNDNYPMMCYELDNNISPIISFNKYQKVIYGDFTEQKITRKFDTIVGNPPYVKQKTGNLYLKFIQLCYNLLKPKGELIFIVPSDFIKLTSASEMISEMIANGSFTDFFFPQNEKLFEGASIDVLIFRYEKNLISDKTNVNGTDMVCNVRNGIITFSVSKITGTEISDLFYVYVGLVSGKDEVYKNQMGNLTILNDKGKHDKYIFTDVFPSDDENINEYLISHKSSLMERRIKKFTDKNWYEWGAPRNIKQIRSNFGKNCIYVKNITRNKEVAFVDTVQYFGGGLLCLIPKEEMKTEQLNEITDFLNSSEFQSDYLYSKRFKIGHKQLSNVIIPF